MWSENPETILTPPPQHENKKGNLRSQSNYYSKLITEGKASEWQIAWFNSYQKYPLAPAQLHYFQELKADKKDLTPWQEAYIISYELNPRAPIFIHYFAQIQADGQKLNEIQQQLLDTYTNSKREGNQTIELLEYLY